MHKTKHIVFVLAYIVSLIALVFFIDRSHFSLLISVYSIAFITYLGLLTRFKGKYDLLLVFVVTRLACFFVLPHFSDDYFRFLWDGMLTVSGSNPYLHFPINEVIELPAHAQGWLAAMNSPNYYSVYPVWLQWIFAAMYWIGGGNELLGVNVFRVIIIILEIACIYLAKQSASETGKRLRVCLPWLLLNPLYVLETFGNIHAEAMVVLLMVLAFLFFEKRKVVLSASFFSLAIATKILPLITIPILLRKLGWKQVIWFGLVALVVLSILSYHFIAPGWFSHQLTSVQLYFNRFEFNASVYYIIRWVGFQFVGYNIIQAVGAVTPWIILSAVLYLQWVKKWSNEGVVKSTYYSILIYCLLSAIVHPWYAIYAILPGVMIVSGAVIVWSFVIMFSYVFYQVGDSEIYYWLVFAEYCLLGCAFIFGKKLNKLIGF
jgi:alpha-1,6-mannosyltransferase